jgi:electron transport complex protein RnfB
MIMTIKTDLVAQIDALLPQTQCTRCGYPSCQKYAESLASGESEINQCPPGGAEGIVALATLLGRPVLELNPANGVIQPRKIALIDEDACIGCALCIKACPVDAIIGANKMLHTVIAHECSSCDLCLPACPVDCISLVDDPDLDWTSERKLRARSRFDAHHLRRDIERLERDARLVEQAELLKRVQGTAVHPEPTVELNSNLTTAPISPSDFLAQIMAKAQQKNNRE